MAERAPLLSFPDPVDEVSARLVAGGVVLLAGTAIVFDQPWLTVPLALGFIPRLVPGPPKRFAQGVGVAFSVTALVLALFGQWDAARVVLGLLVMAAGLES